ncbi:hypothetical protein CPC08DRAFT_757671 [Agrocybe pediades]|nr:hypothetical protein CPC08DRAFT_757671 [Agrocybe pediades]
MLPSKRDSKIFPLYGNAKASCSTTISSSPKPQRTLSHFTDKEEQKFLHNQWDELGEEAADHAKIWHLYNDESTRLDASIVDGCNRGIDVLLVFTGLFSAVLTTFIIESYQQMMPDASDTTNLLLQQLILDLRSSALLNITNTPIDLSMLSPGDPPTITQLRWVNGLWFAALAFSLSAALISMLAKQWIQLIPDVSSSPRQRARQRQRWYMQLQKWHVFAFINALPLLLHIALLLFFAGVLVLLWSGNMAIASATFTIVAMAYIFYLGSMWMSLVDPECPYQHPISEQLRRWAIGGATGTRRPADLEDTVDASFKPVRIPMASAAVDQSDYIDACSITWLLQHSTNDDTLKTALQAIGGLPRTFSAFHVLREADAIPMLLQQFNACFRRDPSFSAQLCIISDPDSAEKYCRGWIRLTHGTSERWPRNLRTPLEVLKDSGDNVHLSAVAACVYALDSLIYRGPQLSLLSHLERFAKRETSYDDFTESWLLETFLECSLSWELHILVINDIVARAVPTLLQLLQRASEGSSSQNRTTITLILHTLLLGTIDTTLLWDEEQRGTSYHTVLIPCLASIIQHHKQYEIEGELLEFAISEFSRLAAPVSVRASHFPSSVKAVARQGLSELYLGGQIGAGILPDSALADMLQLLYPPNNISADKKPNFVKSLLKTLTDSSDMNVATCCIRLLEHLLLDCSSPVLEAFEEGKGVVTLVHVARTSENDSRRLQLECIRTLYIYLRGCLQTVDLTQRHKLDGRLDSIFQSDFFNAVNSTLTSQMWWLPEVALLWMPCMLRMCQIRPQEDIWSSVQVAFRNFAESHIGANACDQLLEDLERMEKTKQNQQD